MIMDKFNATEQSEILEIARLGLAMVHDEIAEELDLSDDHLKALQNKIYTVDLGSPVVNPKPVAGDECPNCKCGTLGMELFRLVCRGECGNDFSS
jgi:hypothetical protein